jgi:hypothetical protein
MSLGLMRRWVWVGSLSLLAFATACESEDEPDEKESVDSGVRTGDSDSGSTEDAEQDADAAKDEDSGSSSMDAGPSAMNVSCGAQQCTGAMVASTNVRACCVGGADAGAAGCGLNADDIKKANPASKFTGCVPKDVPQASPSTYCGEFWDEVESDGKDNGGLDLVSNGVALVYEGCCLESGECGAYLRSPRDIPGIDAHLGCVSFARLKDALSSSAEGGTAVSPKNVPFCNPRNGAPASEGTVGGIPKFVCGCGANTEPVAGAFPPCVANLPKEVCGRDDPNATTLSEIPEYICGCTDNSKLPCLKNVAATVCGTKAVDASSEDLAKLPEYMCGCGPTTVDPGGAIPCLSNVELSTCGKVPVNDATAMEKLPEFLCGCGNDVRYTNQPFPCLGNVDASLCGGTDVTMATDPSLSKVPEFLCGCGNNLRYDGNPDTFRCLSHVAPTLCGALDVPASGHDSLKDMPAYLCGCGNGELYDTESYRCLSNVATTACGALAITAANSPLLSGLPVHLCGCGAENPYAAACLRNVDSRWCGTRDVPVDGKGTTVTTDNCLIGIAEYLRGCGPGTKPTASNPTCLRNVLNYPGCVNTVVDTRGTESTGDDCLQGVPEYAIGCAEDVLTSTDGCLPGAPAVYGCVDVKTTPAQVPEYLCGCGNGQTSQAPPAYPCLTNVTTEVCGGAPVTASVQVVGVLNNVCGCGDGMVRSGCVKNVPSNVCGALPACDANECAGGAPEGRTASCKSSNNDNIVDYCGLN